MEDGMRHTKYLTILSVTAVLTSAHGNVDVVQYMVMQMWK